MHCTCQLWNKNSCVEFFYTVKSSFKISNEKFPTLNLIMNFFQIPHIYVDDFVLWLDVNNSFACLYFCSVSSI